MKYSKGDIIKCLSSISPMGLTNVPKIVIHCIADFVQRTISNPSLFFKRMKKEDDGTVYMENLNEKKEKEPFSLKIGPKW